MKTMLPTSRPGTIGLALATLAFVARPADASGSSNARAMAMGGAQSALADEADQGLWNPALLAIPRRAPGNALLFSIQGGAGVGNTFASFDTLRSLLPDQDGKRRTFSEAEWATLAAGLPESGLGLIGDGGVRVSVASPFLHTGISATLDTSIRNIGIPRGLVDLLLRGNANASSIPLSGLEGAAAYGLANIAVSHAVPLPLGLGRASALGITARYIPAMAFATITEASGSALTLDEEGRISADGHLRYEGVLSAPAAINPPTTQQNLVFDIGFANRWNDNVTWSLMAANIGGNLQAGPWSDKTIDLVLPPTTLGLDLSGGTPKAPDFGSALKDGVGARNGEAQRTVTIPMLLRGGLAWEGDLGLRGKLSDILGEARSPYSVALDLSQGLGEGFGISRNPQASLGAEARPFGRWLALRTGVRLGGAYPLGGLGLGLDLRYLRLDLATGTVGGLFGGAKGSFLWLSTSLVL
ncbi:MAG: hypothetical protein VKP57_13105 [Candidatus Sericytochromatia bacterium]|nr:hypothetical protein [Candidatus Sericytochromatia bacterium]